MIKNDIDVDTSNLPVPNGALIRKTDEENGSFSYEYADSTRVNGSFSVLWYLRTLIADYNSELRRVFLRKQEMASIYDYKDKILVDGMFYNPKKVLSIFSDEVRVYILNEEGESETSPINENGSFSYEYADSTRVNDNI